MIFYIRPLEEIMKKYLSLLLLYPLGLSAQTRGPKETVIFALTALTNGEIEKLIDVTGNAELRNTQALLETIKANPRKRDAILSEYKLLKSWSIENEKYLTNNGREISVVSTRWVTLTPMENLPKYIVLSDKNFNKENIIYVDYMLEKKDNQWKIISRRSY